jgi:tRNA threonylcarbamoyladenosine biosynthesis protein TsaE
MKQRYFINDINKLKFPIKSPSLIFLKWNLWAGKTTISKYILNKLIWIKEEIKSPTYIYYNKYWNNYHFDLYRLRNYDEFFAIWWEEILDNNSWIILIEWPEILEWVYKPDLIIELKETKHKNERKINLIKLEN